MPILKEKKANFDVIKLLQSLSSFVVVVPVVLGLFQYRQSVEENKNKDFREIVAHLSSDKKTERLAGATSLGTFINEGNPRYDDAIDTLVNMMLIESDTDILQAINSSFNRINYKKYSSLANQLLKIDATSFIYKYPLENKLKNIKKTNAKQLEITNELEKKLTKKY